MKVNPKDFTCFNYTPYLDIKDNPMPQKPIGCSYDLGDVVVVEETQAIGVVLGCIGEDGDLRTDVDGMRCWRTPGYLRKATKKDLLNKRMHITDKLLTAILGVTTMKSDKTELVIIDGCGSELLDVAENTANYELSGDGAILINTDDFRGFNTKIETHLDAKYPFYEGLVLLRK